MGKSLKIQDMITIGVYSAIYFVLTAIASGAGTALLPGFSVLLLPGFCALITGPVYLILIKKVPKFGAISTMGIIMGLFFILIGRFILAIVPHIVFGIGADLMAKKGNYVDRRLNQLSFLIFSLNMTGPILPLWFFKHGYTQSLVNRGKDAEYVARTFANITWPNLAVCLIFTVICAAIGIVIGRKIVDKHFSTN